MYHSFQMNRRLVGAAASLMLLVVSAGHAQAQADATKCQRAIAKLSAQYEAAHVKALQKCEDGVLLSKVTPPCPDSKANEAIGKAASKLTDKIDKDCAGLALSAIGWDGLSKQCSAGPNAGEFCQVEFDCSGEPCVPADGCPRLENDTLPAGSCDMALAGIGDVESCLLCLDGGADDQLIDLYAGDFRPTDDKDVLKCQRTLAKATAAFFRTKRKALQKCEDGVLKGKVTPPCPDSTTATKISTAQGKMIDKIGKACGGDDKTLGGGDDLHIELISSLAYCPGFTIPGGPSCASAIGTIEDLADCLGCMTEFKVDCTNRIATTSAGALFPECNPDCGNGKIDTGETCDDGNTLSGDNCPSDCSVASCTPSGSTVDVQVSFAAPSGVTVAGVTVLLDYPDGTVRIPGYGNAQTVLDSISSSLFFTPNDLDYALRNVAFDPASQAITSPELFTVTFQACQGAAALVDADLTCRVEDAADPSQEAVRGVSCSAEVLP